jgi:hypothetical protein
MNIANQLVKTIYFGFDRDHIFLRLDNKKDALTYFDNGFSLQIELKSAQDSWLGRISKIGQALTFENFSAGIQGAVGRIIEMKIPFTALQLLEGGEFSLQLQWSFNRQPFETIPDLSMIKIAVPTGKAYSAYWQV